MRMFPLARYVAWTGVRGRDLDVTPGRDRWTRELSGRSGTPGDGAADDGHPPPGTACLTVRARGLLEKVQRDALREQRLKREIAHEDALVDVVVARRHLVVALDDVRSEVVRDDLRIGGAEPVGVGEAHRVTVGQFGLGYVTLQDGADGVRESRGIRRRVAADHADPLQVPLRLDAGQGGAHLDLCLLYTSD